jgi:uncharacterized membrane protein YphA (DoxX/SURF4 family)
MVRKYYKTLGFTPGRHLLFLELGWLRLHLGKVVFQLIFSAFPGGLPGMSLLLLRAVLGIAMIVEGGTYFGEPGGTITAWVVGAFALVSGGFLLVGFFTSFTASVAGLDIISVTLAAIPAPARNPFDSQAALVFGLTMVVAIIGMGPGRFSVDARMFGRREIIIPLPPSPLER